MRKETRIAIGALMVVVGGLWCVQGLGWLSGSDMTGHPLWALAGAAVAAGGVVAIVRALRGGDRPPMWAVDPSTDVPPAPERRDGRDAGDRTT